MTRMAKKLDIGGHSCARPACPEPRGGGRRRAKPLLQYSTKHWMKELRDGCWHASPKPPGAQRAGGIFQWYYNTNSQCFLSSTSALSRDSSRSGQIAAMDCDLSASDLRRKNISARLTRRFFDLYYAVRFAHGVILALNKYKQSLQYVFSKVWPWENI